MYARQKHYQALSLASRIEAASAHELVTILYEELFRSLDVCRSAVAQGKPEALRSAQDRAVSILLSLQGSLDEERGGHVAASLGVIYRAMHKELGTAVREQNSEKLSALRLGVADLMSAWTAIQVRHAA